MSYAHSGTLGNKPNRVIVGVDYDDQDDDRRRFDNNSGVIGDLALDQNERVKSTGVFLQDELSLTDNIDLSFGVRFDQIDFDVTDRFLADGDDSGSRSLDDTSPMLGIVASLSPTVNIYGTYSTSFETPTTTEFANPGGGGFNPALGPQEAENFEIGLRGSIGDRNRYEVALFDIDVKDELIPFELESSPGRTFFANAGKSSRKGIEFGFSSQPTERIGVNVSYTYSDFEFVRFMDDNGNDFSGNRIPGTVEHLLFGEITYTHPSGWFGALDLLYVGDQFADNANTAKIDSYTISNLRFGVDLVVGSFTVSPFIGLNNLFDEEYNSNIRINAFGRRYFEPAPERNYYAGVTVNFDFL